MDWPATTTTTAATTTTIGDSTTTVDLQVPDAITVPVITTTSQTDAFNIKENVLSSTDKLTFTMTFVLIGIAILFIGVTSRDNFYTYFLSTRRLSFIPLTCSMVMSTVGSAHFVGMAGSASRSGLTVYAYELNSVVAIIFLGWVFFPVYIASGSMTTVDYLKKRYGTVRIEIYVALISLVLIVTTKLSSMTTVDYLKKRYGTVRIEIYVALISLVLIVTTKLSVELFAIFTVLQAFFTHASPAYICVPLLLMALMIPVSGGVRAVIYTNTFQTVLFAIGAFFLAYFSINAFTFSELKEKFFAAWPNTTKVNFGDNNTYKYTTCGIPQTTSWHIFRSYSNLELPWPGMIFGIIINNLWFWCCDQLVVQTGLAAKNIVHCKYACLITAYTKIISIVYLVLPGIVARITHTDYVACADPDICQGLCGIRAGCANQAFPLVFLDIVQPNYRGLVLAAVAASCITSLASALHSGSAIFTLNIYRNVRSNATEVELIFVTKTMMVVLAGLGMAFFNVVAAAPSLYNYIHTLIGVFAPPLVAVYLCGIFWDRAKEENAFLVLMAGLAVGLLRLIWEISKEIVPCGEENSEIPDIIQYFHFLHFAIFLFVLCVTYIIVTGVFTEPILMVHLYRLIYWLRYSKLDRVDLAELHAAYKEFAYDDHSEDGEEKKEASSDKCPRPLGYICCMDGESFSRIVSTSELRETTKYQVSIRESSAHNKALNIHAILLLLISAVMWGYFS